MDVLVMELRLLTVDISVSSTLAPDGRSSVDSQLLDREREDSWRMAQDPKFRLRAALPSRIDTQDAGHITLDLYP